MTSLVPRPPKMNLPGSQSEGNYTKPHLFPHQLEHVNLFTRKGGVYKINTVYELVEVLQ